MTDKKRKDQVDLGFESAEEYYNRAEDKYREAKMHMKNVDYVSSVQASQKCCELSMKGIYGFLNKSFTRKHELIENEYREVLECIPEDASDYDYGRLFEISQVWAKWRNSMHYGNTNLGITAKQIFTQKEAILALEHANDCRIGLFRIRLSWLSSNQ